MGYINSENIKKLLHFCLLIVILILFSKLTIDAVIIGAVALYFFQTKARDVK